MSKALRDPAGDGWVLYDLAAEKWPAIDRWEWWL